MLSEHREIRASSTRSAIRAPPKAVVAKSLRHLVEQVGHSLAYFRVECLMAVLPDTVEGFKAGRQVVTPACRHPRATFSVADEPFLYLSAFDRFEQYLAFFVGAPQATHVLHLVRVLVESTSVSVFRVAAESLPIEHCNHFDAHCGVFRCALFLLLVGGVGVSSVGTSFVCQSRDADRQHPRGRDQRRQQRSGRYQCSL